MLVANVNGRKNGKPDAYIVYVKQVRHKRGIQNVTVSDGIPIGDSVCFRSFGMQNGMAVPGTTYAKRKSFCLKYLKTFPGKLPQSN